jgi:hypothetical protein
MGITGHNNPGSTGICLIIKVFYQFTSRWKVRVVIMVRVGIGFLIATMAGVVFSDIAVTSKARKSLQITVYRDFGVVQDVRNVSLLKGSNRIRFEEVATGIQESSAEITWTGPEKLTVLGQAYEFDLISPAKLMEKFVGKELEIIPSNSKDSLPKTAELLSINGQEPVFRMGTQITFGQVGRILFPYVPDNLYTKPTLIWDVESQERQDIEVTTEYATDGIAWKALYSLDLTTKDSSAKFSGSILLDNKSGVNCRDAFITFVTGNVHRIKNEDEMAARSGKKYGDFYFYTINRPVTVPDNQQKQLEWIPDTKIKYQPRIVVSFDDTEAVSSGSVWSSAHIENSQSNALGLPFPGGVVKVAKRDSQGKKWFIGDDYMDDVKTNSSFDINITTSSDISAVRKKVVEQGKSYNYIIELKNNKNKNCQVKVRDYTCSGMTISSNNKYSEKNAYIEWDVALESDGTAKIQYNVMK